MNKARESAIKKRVIFILCIFCVTLFANIEMKCNASCINSEKPCISEKKQEKLTGVDNDEEIDIKERAISLWNENYMDHFFTEIQKESSFYTENDDEDAIFHAKTLWNSMLKGDFRKCREVFFTSLEKSVRKNYDTFIKIGYWVLLFSILSSLYLVLSDVIRNEQIVQIGEYVLYMVCMIKLISCFQSVYQDADHMLHNVTTFVKLLLPAYATVLGLTNGAQSAAVYYEGILAIIWIIENILSKIVLPAVQLYMMFVVLGGIWNDNRMTLLQKNMKKAIGWALRLMMWILGGMGMLQSLVTPVIDSLEWKSMKKIVGMIPGLGNVSEGISDIFLGSAILVRNGMGVFCTIMLLLLFGIPMLKIFYIALSVKIAAGVGNVISHNRISKIADFGADAFFLLGKVLYTGIGLFILSIAITIFSANRSGF